MTRYSVCRQMTLLAGLAMAGPAAAHHPLNGVPMTGFWQGLVSGLGHPVLGFDHLFFVLAVGLAARFTRWPLAAPLAYLGAMAFGVGLVAAGAALPMTDLLVGLTVVLVGVLMASGMRVSPWIFAGFGLFHGAAFGGALSGAEAASGVVFSGYLLGLVVVQWAIATLAGHLGVRRLGLTGPRELGARLAGAGVTGAGVLILLEMGEARTFVSLGLV